MAGSRRDTLGIVRWGGAGLFSGLAHGVADFAVARDLLPAPLYGAVDDLLLWLAVTALLTLAGGLLGALIAGTATLGRGRPAARAVAAALWTLPAWLGAAALAYRSPVLVVGAAGVGSVVVTGAAALWHRVGRRARLVVAAGLLLAAAACWAANATVLPGLYRPLHATLAYLSLSGLLASAALFANHLLERRVARLAGWLLGLCALVWVQAFVVLPDELGQGVRAVVFGGTVAATHAATGLAAGTDFDGDGASSLLGGGDCDGLDSAVHPGASEVLDDGIDQDCLGGDARADDIAALLRWQASLGLPSGAARMTGASVVLVTVDALRADRAPQMESVRALMARGVSFDRAYAPYPSTILSFFAMMTGRAPSAIRTERWIRWDVPTPDTSRTLAEALAGAGRETAALAFHHIFTPEHGLTRGFGSVWTASSDSRVVVQSRSSEESADRAIAFLRTVDRARPFFLWVHFYDPHEPYLAHPELPVDDPTDLEALYDAEVRYTDLHLARLVAELERQGDLDRSLVVLTSDHGEALGDHGLQFHASALYEEQIRVPLVVVGPGVPANETRSTAVSLLGFAATVTDLVGVPWSIETGAGSWASVLRAEPTVEPPPVFAELLGDHGNQRAVVVWPWKLIHYVDHHTFELFNLEHDPTERVNVHDAVPEAAARLAKLLGDWVASQE